MDIDLKIFRMNRLGIPQERIAKRLEETRDTISDHLGKMPGLAKSPKADLSKGFTVPQVAEKRACPACHVAPEDGTGVGPEDRTGWTDLMVWPVHWKGKVIFKDLRHPPTSNR